MFKIQSINAAIARAAKKEKNATSKEEAMKWNFHLNQLKKLEIKKKNGRPIVKRR